MRLYAKEGRKHFEHHFIRLDQGIHLILLLFFSQVTLSSSLVRVSAETQTQAQNQNQEGAEMKGKVESKTQQTIINGNQQDRTNDLVNARRMFGQAFESNIVDRMKNNMNDEELEKMKEFVMNIIGENEHVEEKENNEAEMENRPKRNPLYPAFISCPTKAANYDGSFYGNNNIHMVYFSPRDRKETRIPFGKRQTLLDRSIPSWLSSVGQMNFTATISRFGDWLRSELGMTNNNEREERRNNSRRSNSNRRLEEIGRIWQMNDIERMINNGFEINKPTLLYVHGWLENVRSGWLMNIRNGYSEMIGRLSSSSGGSSRSSGEGESEVEMVSAEATPPFNLLFFDWSTLSKKFYGTSVSWIPFLGEKVLAGFLENLSENHNYNLSQMHMISFSLGTHLSGLAGRELKKRQKRQQVGQITALDPTGVCFDPYRDNKWVEHYALRPTDAQLVVTRHYDMGVLGSQSLIGGLDIMMNGGGRLQQVSSNITSLSMAVAQQASTQQRRQQQREQRQQEGFLSRLFSSMNNRGFSLTEQFPFLQPGYFSAHTLAYMHESASVMEAAFKEENSTRGNNGSGDLEVEGEGEGEKEEEVEECQEIAYPCTDYQSFLGGECNDCGENGEKCYLINNFNYLRNNNLRQFRPTTMASKSELMFLQIHNKKPFCIYHYQLVWQLKERTSDNNNNNNNNNNQLVREMLKSGSLGLRMLSTSGEEMNGNEIEIRPNSGYRQVGLNKFTALVLQEKKLIKFNRAYVSQLRVNNQPQDKPTTIDSEVEGESPSIISLNSRVIIDSLDHIELNYMSNAWPEKRAKSSFKYCTTTTQEQQTSTGRVDSLVNCD